MVRAPTDPLDGETLNQLWLLVAIVYGTLSSVPFSKRISWVLLGGLPWGKENVSALGATTKAPPEGIVMDPVPVSWTDPTGGTSGPHGE
jgi:hypothetical protein